VTERVKAAFFDAQLFAGFPKLGSKCSVLPVWLSILGENQIVRAAITRRFA
jgi:hypothetical protein